MLKIVFYTQDVRLKVRLALPSDPFQNSCKWKDKLEFIVVPDGAFTMLWTSLLPDLAPEYAELLVDLVSARYPLSPEHKKLKDICPEMIFNNPTDEWVFYGGSFNPWHKGHQACLDLLPEDKVCLMLPDQNPQKELRDIHAVITVLELSNRAKFKKNQFLVPTFLLQQKKNPTVEWIEKMKEEFPEKKLSLLMGFDSFSTLNTWIRVEDLLKNLHTIYVVSRLEDEEDQIKAKKEALQMRTDLNVVFLGKHDYEHLSSTELRRK